MDRLPATCICVGGGVGGVAAATRYVAVREGVGGVSGQQSSVLESVREQLDAALLTSTAASTVDPLPATCIGVGGGVDGVSGRQSSVLESAAEQPDP